MTLSAAELYRRGRAHLNARQNAAARRVLAQAAERTDDPDLRARIAGSLAAVVIRQGDPATAERLCNEALQRPGLRPQTSAMLHGQLGLLALERGDVVGAISLLDRGIAHIGDDREHRTPMLINRSVAHMRAGNLAAARADLEQAAADYAASGDDVERAMAVHNAGYVALLEGNLVEALESMSEARPVMERASVVNAAICDLDRAEVLRDAGLSSEAERALERVARVFGAHRMLQARGEAELNLARSQLAHDPATAARTASAAARRFRTVDSAAWAAQADGIRVRAELTDRVYDLDGMPAARARRTPDAAEVARISAALRAKRLNVEATAVDLSAQLHAADRGSRGRGVRLPASATIDVRLLAHRVRARRALASGREAQARRHAAAGIEELAQWQSAFASLDLQSSVRMHGQPLLMDGLSSAMRSEKPDVLFEWSERARHFNQRIVPLRPPPDPEVAAELAELRMLRGEARGDWLATPRAAELHDDLRRRQWSGTSAAGIEALVTMDELRGALERDTALLSFVWSEGRLVCLVVTAGTARVIEIPAWRAAHAALAGLRSDLDMSASVRSGPLADVVRQSLDDRLRTLSDALLAEPVSVAGVERFLITAPGVLNGVPWGMLPALRGRPFTIASSATRWAGLREASRARVPASAGFAVGPRVDRGREEVSLAAAAWGDAAVLDGDRATAVAVTELASRVDVLHIAAHGRHAADNPLFSGLELADGALFGYDVDLIPRLPGTVVLSACEVGRSSVRWGEEAIGMTRVWLHAGTQCVIAAPVIVADDVACELLGAMHEGLAAGRSPSEALALASERTGIVAPFQAHGAGF
ncbi:MAG: CHAT domain-containing protein [Microbacterium sp.]